MRYIGKSCGTSNIYLETVYDYFITDNKYCSLYSAYIQSVISGQ